MTMHTHQSHPDIVKRLNRARGHLSSVTQMVEDGRHCLDIAQQLHAVEKAIQQAKRTLVLDHRVMVISGVWKQVEGVAYPVG